MDSLKKNLRKSLRLEEAPVSKPRQPSQGPPMFEGAHEQLRRLRNEKDGAEMALRKERAEKGRLEQKIKKMENAHEVEKRNIKTRLKLKAKEKYEIRLNELQKKFKLEIKDLIEQAHDTRLQLIKKDFFIKKLLNIVGQ